MRQICRPLPGSRFVALNLRKWMQMRVVGWMRYIVQISWRAGTPNTKSLPVVGLLLPI